MHCLIGKRKCKLDFVLSLLLQRLRTPVPSRTRHCPRRNASRFTPSPTRTATPLHRLHSALHPPQPQTISTNAQRICWLRLRHRCRTAISRYDQVSGWLIGRWASRCQQNPFPVFLLLLMPQCSHTLNFIYIHLDEIPRALMLARWLKQQCRCSIMHAAFHAVQFHSLHSTAQTGSIIFYLPTSFPFLWSSFPCYDACAQLSLLSGSGLFSLPIYSCVSSRKKTCGSNGSGVTMSASSNSRKWSKQTPARLRPQSRKRRTTCKLKLLLTHHWL